MSAANWASLARARYLNLETYRRDGTSVRTPLWFAEAPGGAVLLAYTRADSAKVKRLRRHPRCRVASCDMRGRLTGPWLDAQAAIADEVTAADAMLRLNRKYWPWKQMLDLLARLRGGAGRSVITIQPHQD